MGRDLSYVRGRVQRKHFDAFKQFRADSGEDLKMFEFAELDDEIDIPEGRNALPWDIDRIFTFEELYEEIRCKLTEKFDLGQIKELEMLCKICCLAFNGEKDDDDWVSIVIISSC